MTPVTEASNVCISTAKLDALYRRYHHRERVHPDPLVFLYRYPDIGDREIVGLIASSLAYGRVAQIFKSLSVVLEKLGPSPRDCLYRSRRELLNAMFGGFTHRFATGNHFVNLLLAIRQVLERYGSLRACFLAGLNPDADTVLPALSHFVTELTSDASLDMGHLIPLPERGSACKRLNLFLRWMVRKDVIDPGGWDNVPASKLIFPLDVHIHRMGISLDLTRRKQADMRTALEITAVFRKILPEDPLRYDFTLCRMGMEGEPLYLSQTE